jgi:hypothetical protein
MAGEGTASDVAGAGRGAAAVPRQHGAVLVDGELLDRNELVREVLQERVINGKLALQSAIGDPAVLLQHGNRLAEDFVERHSGSSTRS